VLQDWADRAPDADHLVAGLKELRGLVGEQVDDSGLCSCIVGIDVHDMYGPTGLVPALPVFGSSADGVVEDEEPRSTRAAVIG
jgi:hypothetical protein